MPSMTSLDVALLVFLGLALLIFSLVKFREPSPVAKMTGLIFLLLAAAAESASAFLFITGASWHLLNARKPWLLINALGGMAPVFALAAFQMMMRVRAAKEAEAKLAAEAAKKPCPAEGVWPPPPTGL